jgi:predicted acetyltransferase
MTATAAGLEIRVLEREGEKHELIVALARMIVDAYPALGIDSTAAFERSVERVRDMLAYPEARFAIAERDGELVGAMRLYDYQMNVRGRDALTGGLGSVAVSLVHKRRGVARALVDWYIGDYRRRGAAFAALYPFRLDFYRTLGFGYGTPMQRYRFAPEALRDDGACGTLRLLGEADLEAILACYERIRASTHGLIKRHRTPLQRALCDAELRYVGVEDGGTLRGFMQTKSIAHDDLRNRDELEVRDLLCEDDGYAAALLGYLRAQRDQFARVTIESQDAAFYLAAADDPRDGSDVAVAPPTAHRVAETGLGIMYRIVDLERAFATLPPAGVPFVLRLQIDDPFVPETGGGWTFRFGQDGAPRRDDGARPDATLAIGIHDLSSVVLGSLRLREAVRHRLATLEPRERLETVEAAFAVAQPPVCATRF